MSVQSVCVCFISLMGSQGFRVHGGQGFRVHGGQVAVLQCTGGFLESLRSSYVQLVGQASCWIQARLLFEDWRQPFLADLWRSLDLHSVIAEKLEDMQLRWGPASGRLSVSARFQHCMNIAADVLGPIMSTRCFDSL